MCSCTALISNQLCHSIHLQKRLHTLNQSISSLMKLNKITIYPRKLNHSLTGQDNQLGTMFKLRMKWLETFQRCLDR